MAAPSSLDDILARLVDRDRLTRVRALVDAGNAHLLGSRVADHACADKRGPLVLTVTQLFRHVTANRSGRHSAATVTWWSEDDGGHGPGLARAR